MKDLNQYVEATNRWRAIFSTDLLSLDTPEGRQEVARRLESDLSPEVLTQDGELTRAQINKRYAFLGRVVKQLCQLDPAVEIHL